MIYNDDFVDIMDVFNGIMVTLLLLRMTLLILLTTLLMRKLTCSISQLSGAESVVVGKVARVDRWVGDTLSQSDEDNDRDDDNRYNGDDDNESNDDDDNHNHTFIPATERSHSPAGASINITYFDNATNFEHVSPSKLTTIPPSPT